jgi:hypothetical protein
MFERVLKIWSFASVVILVAFIAIFHDNKKVMEHSSTLYCIYLGVSLVALLVIGFFL